MRRTLLKFTGGAVAVIAATATSLVAITAYDLQRDVKPTAHLGNEASAQLPPDIGAIEGGVNLLLIGEDSGDGNTAYERDGGKLNDVNILMHIADDHSNATVVSIPRDTFVDIPECAAGGGSYNRINAAFAAGGDGGGLACVVATVEQMSGVSIPFAAQIGFGGVIAMSDAVGGVPVCITEPIDDDNSGAHLVAGINTLQGTDALAFLRTRYGVGDGSDWSRISNQQIFLSSLVRTLKSSETLSNPAKLYALAKAALSNVTLSDTLATPDRLVSIAAALKDIPFDRVNFVQLPTLSQNVPGGGVDPTPEAELVWQAIRDDLPINLNAAGQYVVTDPNQPVIPDPTLPDPAAPTPTPFEAPVNPATGPGSVIDLPTSVTGQTAAQNTCAAGN
ncbi:LCP family protein [Plantibacter sp. RU18]|uniref:LCP family protein n=1 Tax=Plantibacter sp. RU18 TaxID=3158143 RepID=UPI003D3680EE